METLKFVYCQEENYWVGWLEDYPDYRSQGKTLDELKENLTDIYEEWLYNNKDALAMVQRGLCDAAEGRITEVDLKAL